MIHNQSPWASDGCAKVLNRFKVTTTATDSQPHHNRLRAQDTTPPQVNLEVPRFSSVIQLWKLPLIETHHSSATWRPSIYDSFFKANVFKEMKEITNETTYNRTVDMFLYTQKSNYLHKNIFFLRKKTSARQIATNW